jgi:hypothetical protein
MRSVPADGSREAQADAARRLRRKHKHAGAPEFGDEQVGGLSGQHTRFDVIALLSRERGETIATVPLR